MIGMWTSFYFANAIPELETEPIAYRAAHHHGKCHWHFLDDRWVRASRKPETGSRAYLLSMGMVLYTLAVSPSYYAEKGVVEFVGIFVIFIIISIVFIALSFLKPREFEVD